MIYFKIYTMSCSNSCIHCYTYGSPKKIVNESAESIQKILNQIAIVKSYRPTDKIFFHFFLEPTYHDNFIDLMKYAKKIGLLEDNYWFPTNGYNFNNYSEKDIQNIKNIGVKYIQLSFFGDEDLHDKLVQCQGAHNRLFRLIKKCHENNLEYAAALVLTKEVMPFLEKSRNQLIDNNIGDQRRLPVTLYTSEGRGQEDKHRITYKELEEHDLSRLLNWWNSEKNIIYQIENDSSLSNQYCLQKCTCGEDFQAFNIFGNGDIFFGGGCDFNPPLFFDYKEKYLLGNIFQKDIISLIQKLNTSPPQILSLLKKVTWKELCERYGNFDNDHLYEMRSLVENKWAGYYLRENM